MTALEAVGAVAIGLVAGLKLPAWVESSVAKLTGKTVNLTSGSYRPYIAGAVAACGAAYLASTMLGLDYKTASAIALAGVAVNALNLLATMNVPYVPSIGLGGGGHRPFGMLGAMTAAEDPLAMTAFGDHQGYEYSNSAMFGSSSRDMNFY